MPSDLPIKNIWIWGSDTSNGWNYPFLLPLEYDANAAKGTFVIETTLTEGELKFGLENDPNKGGNINWLRPLSKDVTMILHRSLLQIYKYLVKVLTTSGRLKLRKQVTTRLASMSLT